MRNYTLPFLITFLSGVLAGAQTVSTVAGVLETPGFNDGAALSARFFNPHGIAVDSAGNVYVADRYNHTIRKYLPATAQVITLAGTAGQSGATDGKGPAARFNEPWGLCVTPGGTVYVADTKNNKVRRVSPDGAVTTVAGTGNFGTSSGAALASTFGNPTGIDVDAAGNLYVADHLTHIIRKITPAGWVSTLAGTPYIPGNADGQGGSAQFWRPYGLHIAQSGDILVADEWNHRIRRITANGLVTTVAGLGVVGYADGDAAAATFNYPWDVTTDPDGNLYVADGYNYVLRKITPGGTVSTLAGQPLQSGGVDGPAASASFSGATSVAWCPKTSALYIGDAYNHLVRKLTFDNAQAAINLLNLSGKSQFCAGEPVQVTASGSAAFSVYRFRVDGAVVQNSALSSFSSADLAPGPHSMVVETDYQGNTLISNTLNITIAPLPAPEIIVAGDLQFYTGDSVMLIASGQGSFLWSNGSTTPAITVFQSGTFTVQLTADGCTGTSAPVTVQVTTPPSTLAVTATLEGDSLLCPGASAVLYSSAPAGNQWLKDGWPLAGATGVSLTVSASGVYQVQRTDAQSGVSVVSAPVKVNVRPAPAFDFIAQPREVQPGQDVSFHLTGTPLPINVEWDFGDAQQPGSVLLKPVVAYETPGTYTITLQATDIYGCPYTLVKADYVRVTEAAPSDLFIPSAFTPNGDGVNDVFRVRGPLVHAFSLAVFNQWGEALYSSKDQSEGWDGTRNGLPVHSGTYVYLLNYQTAEGERRQAAGHVTLIR